MKKINNLSFFSLLLVILSVPVAQIKLTFWGVPIYVPEVFILSSLGLFLWEMRNNAKVILPDRKVLLGIGFFFSGALVSFISNPFSLTGLGMLKSWIFFPVLFGLLLWGHLRDEAKRKQVLLAWFGVGFWVTIRSLSFWYSGHLTYDGRLAGDYTSPNFLAFLVAPLPLLAYFFLSTTRWIRRSFFWTFFMVSGGLGSLLVLWFTHSYGPGLSVLLVFFAWFGAQFWHKKTRTLLFLMIVLGLGALSLLGKESASAKWQILTSLNERSSIASRIMIWRATEKIITDHPLTGIGIGRFQEVYLAYQRYFPPYLEWAVPQPHNFLLALFLATGVLGLAGFALLFGWPLRVLVRWWLHYPREREWQENAFLVALSLEWLIMGLIDTPYFKNDLALVFFVLWALILSKTQLASQKKPF